MHRAYERKKGECMENINEAWYRFCYCILGFICCVITFSLYSGIYTTWLFRSLIDVCLIDSFLLTEVQEGLLLTIFLPIFLSFFACVPVWSYMVWAFLVPGLRQYERQVLNAMCRITFILQVVILTFWFHTGNALMWKVFEKFSDHPMLLLQPKALPFIALNGSILSGLLLLGVVPAILQAITHFCKIPHQFLRKCRKPILALCCLTAAWVTPGDPVSQFCVTVLFWILLEGSFFFVLAYQITGAE